MIAPCRVRGGPRRLRELPTLAHLREQRSRQRERAQCARRGGVELTRAGQLEGSSLRSTAQRLGVARSTLSGWCVAEAEGRLAARALGRPPRPLTRAQREVALFVLKVLGARASGAWLKWLIPEASRSALYDLARRARYVWRRRGRVSQAVLSWKRVGAVWACDFTDPDETLEGGYTAVFVVRDLASGKTLCSQALRRADTQEVVAVLSGLFARYGAPLVLKSDNGSALVAWAVDLLLALHGVLHLRSPVRMPRYNGACEAGIGSLKVLADRIAAQHGRVGQWSCDDVEAARRLANATSRAPCDGRRPADAVWAVRERLCEPERRELYARYHAVVARERELRGHAVGVALGINEQASIDRVALGRALVEAGILEVRWRSISPPI